jgi:hypothetical protein
LKTTIGLSISNSKQNNSKPDKTWENFGDVCQYFLAMLLVMFFNVMPMFTMFLQVISPG